MPSIIGLEKVNEAQTAIHKAERTLLIAEVYNNEKERQLQYDRLAKAQKNAEDGLKMYEPLPQTKEEETGMEAVQTYLGKLAEGSCAGDRSFESR